MTITNSIRDSSFNHISSMIRIPAHFDRYECDAIKAIAANLVISDASIKKADFSLANSDSVIDQNWRKSKTGWIDETPETEWIFSKLQSIIVMINANLYNYEIDAFEPLQYTIYEEGGHYDYHYDSGHSNDPRYERKLSFSVQLSESDEYDGCDLELTSLTEPVVASRGLGDMAIFSSLSLHRVTPLTRGKRESLVGWVVGTPFR